MDGLNINTNTQTEKDFEVLVFIEIAKNTMLLLLEVPMQ